MANKTFEVFMNEKYMSDATLSAFCNIAKAVKDRDRYIWSGVSNDLPDENRVEEVNSTSLQQSKHDYMKVSSWEDSVCEKENALITKTTIPVIVDKNMEVLIHKSKHDIVENARRDAPGKLAFCNSETKLGSGISAKEEENVKGMHEQMHKKVSEVMNIDCVDEIINTSTSFVKKKPRIKQRSSTEQFNKQCNATSKKYPILPPEPSDNHKSVMYKKSSDHAGLHPVKQNPTKLTKKRIRHCSESTVEGSAVKQKISPVNEKHRENNEVTANESMLCVKITCKKTDRSYEVMTDDLDLFRLKRNFPKLSDVFPFVDVESKEIYFSAEAVKAALGFLFNPSYNFDLIQNKIIALEVLAIFQSWEIDKFQGIVQKFFLQNFLLEENTRNIYPVASHFELKEICDAFRQLSNGTGTLDFSTNYRPKKCSIAVSTYIEPLEFSIPLESVAEQLTVSFDRSLQNEIIFEAISGCYVITGFQIQLNVDEINKNTDPTKLKIFYSAENTTEKFCVEEQKADKPLRSRIIIYLKKNFILKPNQKGKISVYTDIKPCLCFTFQEDTISKKDFNLTLTSTFKISDKKCFFIGKLFYYIKSNV